MTHALAALTDNLSQTALLALLLERSLSLLFSPPHAVKTSRRLPTSLTLRLPLHRGSTMDFPLFETLCLTLAFWLSAMLPIAPLLPSWPPELANGLSALFVTALASGLRQAIYHAPAAHLHASLGASAPPSALPPPTHAPHEQAKAAGPSRLKPLSLHEKERP